ncbi:hypothetical protein INS49_006613 [Diaporthe citri]|uniref:uncharacterized protein n=1 Tax=Diaporthe citri TaxID=83186 RepID=UPI001C7FE8C9|nr:uncharacterized protein INS49_006613 [Diaporthe citri]KAG6365007.1 hypothetical protein INS49_006613 [Diaporthe citri]
MHCIYRPMYILHTREFAPQDDDLNMDDFTAARAVMANLGRTVPQMTLYNCGAEAGASQGHKHMQVFAYPSPFPLFPEQAQSTQESPVFLTSILCYDFLRILKRITL